LTSRSLGSADLEKAGVLLIAAARGAIAARFRLATKLPDADHR
jgi:hypothetical protein